MEKVLLNQALLRIHTEQHWTCVRHHDFCLLHCLRFVLAAHNGLYFWNRGLDSFVIQSTNHISDLGGRSDRTSCEHDCCVTAHQSILSGNILWSHDHSSQGNCGTGRVFSTKGCPGPRTSQSKGSHCNLVIDLVKFEGRPNETPARCFEWIELQLRCDPWKDASHSQGLQ